MRIDPKTLQWVIAIALIATVLKYMDRPESCDSRFVNATAEEAMDRNLFGEKAMSLSPEQKTQIFAQKYGGRYPECCIAGVHENKFMDEDTKTFDMLYTVPGRKAETYRQNAVLVNSCGETIINRWSSLTKNEYEAITGVLAGASDKPAVADPGEATVQKLNLKPATNPAEYTREKLNINVLKVTPVPPRVVEEAVHEGGALVTSRPVEPAKPLTVKKELIEENPTLMEQPFKTNAPIPLPEMPENLIEIQRINREKALLEKQKAEFAKEKADLEKAKADFAAEQAREQAE